MFDLFQDRSLLFGGVCHLSYEGGVLGEKEFPLFLIGKKVLELIDFESIPD